MNSQSEYRYYNQNDYYYQYRPLETNVNNNNYNNLSQNDRSVMMNLSKYNSVQNNKCAETTPRQSYTQQNFSYFPFQPNPTHYNNSASWSQYPEVNNRGFQQNDSMQNNYFQYGQSGQNVYTKTNNSATVHWQNLQNFKPQTSEPRQSWHQICTTTTGYISSNEFTALPTTANLANILVHSGGQVIQNKTIVADAKIIKDDEVFIPKKATVKRTRKTAHDIPITVAAYTSESQLLDPKTKAAVKRKTIGKINTNKRKKSNSSITNDKGNEFIDLLDQFPFSTGSFDIPEEIVIPEPVDLLKNNKPICEEKDQPLSQLLDSVY